MAECKMLAVDVDGTLLEQGRVDPADAAALRAAAEGGILPCLCTGRSWDQVRPIWQELALPRPQAPVICVGGALVTEPSTGRTLYSRPFDRPTADDLARAVVAMGYPAMALVDAWREGFDYFLMGPCEQVGLYQEFLAARELRVRRVERLSRPGDPPTLRISLLADGGDVEGLVAALRQQFGGRVEAQGIYLRHADLHIVEAFRAGTNKFTAMVYVGQGDRISPAAMAAIGDDHNDLAMLTGAGVSATTADAPPELLQAADMVLAPRGQRPVAQFVAALLARRQGPGATAPPSR